MLLNKNNTNYELKMIDFGTAKLFDKGEKLTKFIGTSYYIAPEVLKEFYDEKCDIWSCGIIFYILLTGFPPFNGNSNKEIYNNIKYQKLDFDSEEWRDISFDAIDLVRQMLDKRPEKRLSADQCLNHKWFRILDSENDEKQNKKNKNISIKAIERMTKFVQQNKLKQAIMQYLTSQFNLKEEEERLRNVFMQFDPNKKGMITKNDFKSTLNKLFGENEAVRITENIFRTLDSDKSGEISYNEFITSIIDDKYFFTHDKLEKAFKMFDKDKSGKISVDEISSIFGGEANKWKKIIKEIDLNNDGEIDFKEFKAMMSGIDEKEINI
jgi:calcium-dependent protein kinase